MNDALRRFQESGKRASAKAAAYQKILEALQEFPELADELVNGASAQDKKSAKRPFDSSTGMRGTVVDFFLSNGNKPASKKEISEVTGLSTNSLGYVFKTGTLVFKKIAKSHHDVSYCMLPHEYDLRVSDKKSGETG